MENLKIQIFGIRIYCKSNLFCEIIFRPQFNDLQIINIIEDIYSNLHKDIYYYQYLLLDNKWTEFPFFNSINDFINDFNNNKISIGYTEIDFNLN